jgi:UDP-N-acetylmuramate dehydrogenase
MDGWRRAACEVAGVAAREAEPLSRHTTFGIGGPADVWAEVSSEAGLAALLGICQSQQVRAWVMGRGSNLLVSDQGLHGVVVRMAGEMAEVAVEGSRVRAGAGARMDAVVDSCEERGLCGAEFLAGIPGSIGGGLLTNAGAYGRQLSDVVTSVRGLDSGGQVVTLGRDDFSVGYRQPLLPAGFVATEVVLDLVFGRPEPARQVRERRWAKLPSEPSAGSFFRNPDVDEEVAHGYEGTRVQAAAGRVRVPAGWLIERCGLKGRRAGGAMVSERHANFIVNVDRASCADVLELVQVVKAVVEQAAGVRLREEVQLWPGGA